LAAASPAQAAQPKIGAQGVFALPLGDFGDISGVGFGALLTLDYGLTDDGKLQLTGRMGYVHMTGKEIDGPSYGLIPVYAGVKFFLIPGLYLGGELGLTVFSTAEQEISGVTVEGDTEIKIGGTAGIGYMFKDLDMRAFLWLPSLGDGADIMAMGISVGYRFLAL
jgi:hypothetical protein